jgi:uncharacterized membrane protein
MTENIDRINLLLEKMENLLKRQESFSEEVNELKEEISRLKTSCLKQEAELPEAIIISSEADSDSDTKIEIKKDNANYDVAPSQLQTDKEPLMDSSTEVEETQNIRADLEKFIGENLINKIGIVITVIGVAIGAKYAIDHQLISPLIRIILGYLIGIGLLFFAIRLKRNYKNFSSVLLSGSMAILYFITYAAYSFYGLIPQLFAFFLMVIFTAFTVTAAINYNRQVIAHIGLVGAYAVPFLLSDGSENVTVLFSYTAIINIGILVISFKKYWKPLYYSSFLLTWLIYLTWFVSKYQTTEHFGLGSTFLLIFFAIFYLMLLAYKLLRKEKFDIYDIVLVLANSFIFYGIGYKILSTHDTGEHLLGLFTLCNAIVHSIVSAFIYREKLADRNLFYLISGLALVFITISIPVQLNGNWVTLLWAGEAASLFWIGRTQKVQFYEILSYALMVVAFSSLIQDWTAAKHAIESGQHEMRIIPLFNIRFVTSVLFIGFFGFINALNHNSKYPSPFISQNELCNLISFSISTAFLIVLYYSFKIEISTYWNQLHKASLIELKTDNHETLIQYWNIDLVNYKNIWLINYSLLFLSILSIINIKKLLSRTWGYINLYLNTISIVVFLILGLYILSELRESYLNQTLSEYYHRGIFNIVIRYVSFVFAALLLAFTKMYADQPFLKPFVFNHKIAFDILLYITLIWIISSELLSWMKILQFSHANKLALSILWGVYSLFLIVLGIWKKKIHLRIAAIALFALTLLKLFFYDLSHLNTISKTIVFVTLGILLLIISFLYNKYKHIIAGNNGN